MDKVYIENSIRIIEDKIGYIFIDKDIIKAALTHISFINENSMVKTNKAEDYCAGHNERLEFLGDAVLEIIITEELFYRFPHEREGVLTNKRSSLVKEQCVAQMARQLKLNELLRMGKGEESTGGRGRDSILGDSFEALLGAMYIDALKAQKDPLVAVRTLIKKLYEKLWNSAPAKKEKKDNKTLLQELTQEIFKLAPKYVLIQTSGAAHKQEFTVQVHLPDKHVIEEKGSSKRIAEQKAAEKALLYLQKNSKN